MGVERVEQTLRVWQALDTCPYRMCESGRVAVWWGRHREGHNLGRWQGVPVGRGGQASLFRY